LSEDIESLILFIRGKRVILDAHLAILYGTSTKRLNEQVRRNRERFPDDFMFRLTATEMNELVANCDQFNNFKHLREPSLVFTEFGAIQAANVLRNKRAVEVSVFVVRAFVRMREALSVHKDILRKINDMESKYDGQFRLVFEALRKLMDPPAKPRRRIGFGGADR
jgi:hypothetical protein